MAYHQLTGQQAPPGVCGGQCTRTQWTPLEGTGNIAQWGASWCVATPIDWGTCSNTAFGRYTCTLPADSTSPFAYSFTNRCCTKRAPPSTSCSPNAGCNWVVRPELLSGFLSESHEVLNRVDYNVPAFCNCTAYGDFVFGAGGSDPRRICTCNPHTGGCVPQDFVFSVLTQLEGYIVAGAFASLPFLALVCLSLTAACGSYRIPAPVLLTILVGVADVFTDLLYVTNNPFSTFQLLALQIFFITGTAVPYALFFVLPSALTLGGAYRCCPSWSSGGPVWCSFRECVGVFLTETIPAGASYHFEQLNAWSAEQAARRAGGDRFAQFVDTIVSALSYLAVAFFILLAALVMFLSACLAYAVCWFVLFVVVGSLLWRAELLTLPLVTKWLTGVEFTEAPGAPMSPTLYHVRQVATLFLQSIPALALQCLNNSRLSIYGIPNAWSLANIVSVVFSGFSACAALAQVGRQLKRHGFALQEWDLPRFTFQNAASALGKDVKEDLNGAALHIIPPFQLGLN